jgi:DHA2 family multidrug resistance protein
MTAQAPAAGAAPFGPKQALQIAVVLGAYVLMNTSAQLLATTLPDLQAPAAASADEASWLATAFVVGVFAGLVTAFPLLRAFGLGRYIAAVGGLYALLALACTTAPALSDFVALRGLQGLAVGGLGPSAFVVVFTLAQRPRLMGGLAVLAFALLLPSTLGPASAGLLEARLGWQGLFWVQAVAGGASAAAAMAWLPRPPVDLTAFRTDWVAILLLAAALGALTVALSQGTRRFWLESVLIQASLAVALGSLAGFALLVWRRGSVINPRLLVFRPFIAPVSLNLVLRVGLAIPTVVVPQFLVTLHGYRPAEIGGLFLWVVAAQACALPIAWWLLHRVDGRLVIVSGLILVAGAALVLAHATAAAAAPDFRAPMALIGLGQVLFLTPGLQAGADVLSPPDGPTASIAFNVTSTGGGVLGAALASHLSMEREKFHSATLVEQVPQFAPATDERLATAAGLLSWRQPDQGLAEAGAAALLDHAVRQQAWSLAFNDTFLLFGLALAVAALGVLAFEPQPPLVAGHRPPVGPKTGVPT